MVVRKHSSAIWQIFILVVTVSLWSPDLSSGILSQARGPQQSEKASAAQCDPALPLSDEERSEILGLLRRTKKGQLLLNDYVKSYKSLGTLVIQWDSVSYSQISRNAGRTPASTQSPSIVCIHLAKRLPEIEHVADLAHELTHATRLTPKVLKGEGMEVQEFVKARIGATGGEADAFAVECEVKRELLGHWDHFCNPYVSTEDEVDVAAVVRDLYNGSLAASLTGEAYPVMLAKQFSRMSARKQSSKYLNGVQK